MILEEREILKEAEDWELPLPNNIDEDARSIWNNWYRDLGTNEHDNPYITYIDRMHSYGFDKEDLIALNNMWADDIIDRKDLTDAGMKSLIYNGTLFDDRTADDIEWTVKEYNNFEKNHLRDYIDYLRNTGDNSDKGIAASQLKERKHSIFLDGNVVKPVDEIKNGIVEFESSIGDPNGIVLNTNEKNYSKPLQYAMSNIKQLSKEDQAALKQWLGA